MYVVVNFDENGVPYSCNGTIFGTQEEAFDMADLLASYLERSFNRKPNTNYRVGVYELNRVIDHRIAKILED